MPLTNAAAGFIGASVTLVLVIIFMILMVILVRQCLAFLAKRNTIRAQVEQQRQQQEQLRRRRGSITEPVPATFDWHHSIRIAGTPPPTYHEAKKLPSFDDAVEAQKKEKVVSENGTTEGDSVDGNEIIEKVRSSSNEEGNPGDSLNQSNSEHTSVEVAVEENGTANHIASSQESQSSSTPSRRQQHQSTTPNQVEIDVERLQDETRTTFSTGYTEFGATAPM